MSVYYIVSLSEHAFFTIITSALEAYKVSHNDGNETHIPIETYGNLWGYLADTRRNNEMVFRVVQADVDTSATRQADSVRSKQEAFSTKVEFIDTFMPELEYLGDFHSHPYDFGNDGVNNVLELERKKFNCFSKDDFSHTRYLQKVENRNYRLGIVATVYEMHNKVKRENKHIGDDLSCIRFMYDNIAIWIKAYVFEGEKFKKVEGKNIGLICHGLGFHAGTIEQR